MSTIDLKKSSWTSFTTLKSRCFVITDISDHLPCFYCLPHTRYKGDHCNYIQICQYSTKACHDFYEAVKDANLIDKLVKDKDTGPNDNYNTFENILVSLKEKYLPLKTTKFNKYKHKRSSWITNAIIKSIKYRDNLYKSLKLTQPLTNDHLVKKQNLKVYNSILHKCIRQAKQTHFSTELHKFRKDISQTWKVLKNIINSNNQKNHTTTYTINDSVTSDHKIISEAFNNYFSSLGSKLASEINLTNVSIENYLTYKHNSSFSFTAVSHCEVNKIVMDMSSKNSSGYDNISPKLIKSIAPLIVPSLTLIKTNPLLLVYFLTNLKLRR